MARSLVQNGLVENKPNPAFLQAFAQLHKEVEGSQHALKHVEVKEKSSSITDDVKLREAPQKALFAEIQKTWGPFFLKPVTESAKRDKSEPVIDSHVKIGEAPMKAVLAEVGSGSAILAHKKVNKEIVQGHELKHVEPSHDSSAPKIDSGVHIKEAPQKKVFEEISKDHSLKHVDDKDVHDASKPVIDTEVKIGEAPMKAVLADVAAGGSAEVNKKRMAREIGSAHDRLKHVDDVHDKSAPHIDTSVVLREAPQKGVMAELTGGVQLKKVDEGSIKDKSQPQIDPNAKIGENPMSQVLAAIASGAGGEAPLKHVEPKVDHTPVSDDVKK